MKITLSPRLAACCRFVVPGSTVADVGCDHGYLGIYLLQNNLAESVIAADVRPGPLSSAVSNSEKYGVRDKMRFFCTDGLQGLPRDFDTLVCAGMGADTMIAILSQDPWIKSEKYRLVLQCQSKQPELRRFLSENGWQIREESILRDGRFLYTVMDVRCTPGTSLTPGQWYFPPALLQNPGPELPEYYQRVVSMLKLSLTGKHDPEKEAALCELELLIKSNDFAFLRS